MPKVEACTRCGGQVVRFWDEKACINCGQVVEDEGIDGKESDVAE
jgi:hypothetical protein